MTWREEIESLEKEITFQAQYGRRATVNTDFLQRLIAFVKDAGKAVDDANAAAAITIRDYTQVLSTAQSTEASLRDQLTRTHLEHKIALDTITLERNTSAALTLRVVDLEKAQEALLRRLANTRLPFARNRG